jgi:2-polyprenyl-3-methyl-5-hydroxy-6-metoxy-1,4-benzoquinol methylase
MSNIKNEKLRKEIIDYTQWPYGKREVQYQTVDPSLPGIRNMEHRYDIIKFPKSFKGETVIDIGCNIGMICFDAKRRGAKRVVGIDYKKETIEVAKKLTKELDLDVEFYTFDVNDGLEKLKSIIGDEQFDHVFALSIWGHVDKPKLSDIINYYLDKVCWFEGHAAGWTGDTKDKMDSELTQLLSFDSYEYLGETLDRNPRQNYKLSNSKRVVLKERDKYVYFDGDVYEVIRTAYEVSNSGDLSYSEDVDRYSYKGKYSSYISTTNSDIGHKIFIEDDKCYDQNLSEKRNVVENIYDIQNILHSNGFAPQAHQIITCHDDQTFFYAIEVDNLKGKFVEPSNEWKESLIQFCDDNGIYREGTSIEKELVVDNCIEVDGKIYLVDIDLNWRKK